MRKPKRALRLRLWDILRAIEIARRAVADLTLDEFQSDDIRRSAAERCVEIISEASRHIPPQLQAEFEHVPWRQIASIGNILRHGYDIVDAEIIWKLTQVELSALEEAVRQILSEVEEE